MANIIVAYTKHSRVIGQAGKIPWDIREDRVMFRTLTVGSAVVMGRKTWESLPAPLTGRTNIVVSKSGFGNLGLNRLTVMQKPLVIMVTDLNEAVNLGYEFHKRVFIIGGEQIYRAALEKNLVEKIFATEIEGNYEGDTYFPELSDEWEHISTVEKLQHPNFRLKIYEKLPRDS